MSTKSQHCSDLLDGIPLGFTMYNIWCKDGQRNETLMHFYHKSDDVTGANQNKSLDVKR